MKVYCTSCQKTSRPSELLAQDIYNYEFTSEGLQALSSNDALLAVSKDVWAGYSRFDSFLSQIRLFSYSHEKNESVIINRFKLEGSVNREVIMHFVDDLQRKYHYHNLSFNSHYIFMAAKVQHSGMEALKKQMEEEYVELQRIVELRNLGTKLVDQNFLYQPEGEKIDDFIKRISNNQ
jgi:hypothetical protein